MAEKKSVLFLCTGNSARSQMAEGLMRHLRGDEFEVYSAGIDPKGVHPVAIQVMAEIGIDLAGHRSKHVDGLSGKAFDYTITLCGHAAETCPVFPGSGKRMHRGFTDPAAADEQQQAETFRKVRDEIKEFVLSFSA